MHSILTCTHSTSYSACDFRRSTIAPIMTSSPDIEIRPASDNDEDATVILRCLAAAFEPYRKHYSPSAFADSTLTNETVRLRLKQMHVLVATLSGNVVGTIGAAWHPEIAEAHLRGMA